MNCHFKRKVNVSANLKPIETIPENSKQVGARAGRVGGENVKLVRGLGEGNKPR